MRTTFIIQANGNGQDVLFTFALWDGSRCTIDTLNEKLVSVDIVEGLLNQPYLLRHDIFRTVLSTL